MPKKLSGLTQGGYISPQLFFILAAVGLIIYLLLSSTLPFKDKLFSVLYPKPSSYAASQTLNLNAVADTYVHDAKRSTNFGTATTLIVDNVPDIVYAYLKFDLAPLAGKTITAAKLRFKTTIAASSGSTNSISIKLVGNTSWNENTLIWTNKPALSSGSLGTISKAAANTWYEAPLNATTIQSKVGQLLSLAIKSGEGDDLLISSKETADIPQLVVSYAVSGPTSTPAPTFTPAPTPTPASSIIPTPTSRPSSTPTPAPSSTPVPPAGGIWKPAMNTPWHWMIDHALNINNQKDMGLVDPNGNLLSNPVPVVYDIDGFYNGLDPNCNIKDKNGVCVQGQNDVVKQLHAMGKKVICYVDLGVYESYREDAYKFPASVIGSPDAGWDGSYWLDIRRTDILGPIMKARMQMCKDKGYDAIEPDEIDGYENDTKFGLTYQDQINYNKFIAQMAHDMGMSIGLKGDTEQVKDLWPYFDWTLNEECYQYNECNLLKPFSDHGKAVFQVEYKGQTANFCPNANSNNWNSMKMPLNLNGGRWPCR